MIAASKTDDQSAVIFHTREFQELVSARRKLSYSIALINIVSYFSFIFLVAFAPDFLGQTIGDSSISIGIYLGLALIIFSFLLTGIYLKVSNSKINKLQEKLHQMF